MIKINVAEIKKHLTGSKTFQLNVEPAELDITAADLVLTGKVRIEGTLSNVGDVLLLEARVCGRNVCFCGGEILSGRKCGR